MNGERFRKIIHHSSIEISFDEPRLELILKDVHSNEFINAPSK